MGLWASFLRPGSRTMRWGSYRGPGTEYPKRCSPRSVSLGRCLDSRPRRPGTHWPVDCGRSPAPLWTDCSDPWLEQGQWRSQQVPGPRPPCELAGLGVGERERADGEVVNGHDASLAHPVSPLQFRAPASIQWAVAVALAAVQDRTQEADAPFPAVNPCGGACLTLAPSPPPISPSLPRLPSGRRLSPARRVPSRILYSRKDLEERLYNHLLISCAEKKSQRAHPLRFQSPPNKPGYRTFLG